jgi:hypothetical protein
MRLSPVTLIRYVLLVTLALASPAAAQVALNETPIPPPPGASTSQPKTLNTPGTVAMSTDLDGAWTWSASAGWINNGGGTIVDINDSGAIIAAVVDPNNGRQFATFKPANGPAEEITGFPPNSRVTPLDINNPGDVFGWYFTDFEDGTQFQYFIWNKATGLTSFYPDIFSDNALLKFNDSRQFVGLDVGGAFVWDATNGLVRIPKLSNPYAFVQVAGINNLGQVAGSQYEAFVNIKSFLWDPATGIHEIPAPASYFDSDYFIIGEVAEARGLNDLGQVVGRGMWGDHDERTFVWDADNGMRQLFATPTAHATAINNQGMAVGWTDNGSRQSLYGYLTPPVPPTPQAQTEAVGDKIETMVAAGILTANDGQSVIVKLDAAILSLDRGNIGAATNQLNAAKNKVNALVNSHRLSAAKGQEINDALNAILIGL